MMKADYSRESDAAPAGRRLAAASSTNLVVDFSYFKEGYGFSTPTFDADINGGFTGYYYLDNNHRVDFSNILTFQITGTDYADSIEVGDGKDIVNAGGGNDVVTLGLGRDKADGGAGIDGFAKSYVDQTAGVTVNLLANTTSVLQSTVRNFEYFANVTGSDFDDVFISSDKRGNDVVAGGDGNDRASFGIGYDRFTGGNGTDTLGANFAYYLGTAGIQTSLVPEDSGEGYRGYYYVDGTSRVDFSTTEAFQITGTKNNDSIVTGIADDTVAGGAGNDVVSSSSGTDALDGGAGVDGVGHDFSLLTEDVAVNLAAGTLTGAAGSITTFEYFSAIVGGFGNDTFLGTAALANDNVNGGGGNDTASFYAGTDVYTGGAGNDRAIIDYSAVNVAGIQTSLTADTDGGYRGYFYVDQPHRTDFTSVEAFTITGTAFGDTIVTGDGDDIVSAGGGNDVVQTGAGVDTLDGGAGIDGVGRNLSALSADVAIDLAAGTATGAGGGIVNFEYFAGYSGSQKADTLVSTREQANDNVTGGGGNDTLTVYQGTDVFAGGIGVDRLIVDYSAIDVGAGISYSQDTDSAGGFRGYYYIQQATRIDYTSVEAFTITGTAYNDTLVTKTGDDRIAGGDGDDIISTGSGNDVDNGGDGFDGIGRDFSPLNVAITFDLNTSKLQGVAGNTMKGFEYLYDVKTGSGADTFRTLHIIGNDVVSSGGGNDTMDSYGGYDRFAAGSGTDTLTVDYSGIDSDNGVQTSIGIDNTNGGFQGYVYLDSNVRVDFSGAEIFNVIATNRDDTLAGGSMNDVLTGLDGRDSITGNGGNDTLSGGLAADTLNGGLGRDTLIGGAAGDSLTGGGDADRFVFATADFGPVDPFSRDRIMDFSNADRDKIDLSKIDADTATTADDAFTFVSGGFTAAGQVHVVTVSGITYLEGNFNADLAADFVIRVDGSIPIATDLVL